MKSTVSAFDVEKLYNKLHCVTLTLLAIHTAMEVGNYNLRCWMDAVFFVWNNLMEFETQMKDLYEGEPQTPEN